MAIAPSDVGGGGVWTIGSVRRYWRRLKGRRAGVPAIVDADLNSKVGFIFYFLNVLLGG
jgi:hypothetical protein